MKPNNRLLKKRHVAVVVPAFCAERQIADVLDGMPGFLTWIVVVDDCSTDDTGNVVLRKMQGDPDIRLLRHEVNRGVGGAMLTGYREALCLPAPTSSS